MGEVDGKGIYEGLRNLQTIVTAMETLHNKFPSRVRAKGVSVDSISLHERGEGFVKMKSYSESERAKFWCEGWCRFWIYGRCSKPPFYIFRRMQLALRRYNFSQVKEAK